VPPEPQNPLKYITFLYRHLVFLVPTGWYPPNGQEQAYDDGWYDYNNYYLGGPCMEPPMEWDDGCGGDNTVPFCDEATCTRSCYQFMGYDRGVCLQNECFCRKSSNQQPPAPEQDWNYDTQSGNLI
jgi:hypothetical protein